MTKRKSKKMVEVEKRFGKQLEDMLPSLVTSEGLTQAAATLGLSKATVGYWLLRLGIQTVTVALGPGEKATVTNQGGRVAVKVDGREST